MKGTLMEQFERYLPDKPISENADFVIYCNENLEDLKDDIIAQLSIFKRTLLSFFGFKDYPKVQINLFNNHEDYLKFTRQFYEPASYSIGNFTNGMISYFYNATMLRKITKCLSHELVHLFYESIWRGNYDRVIWLDEGLAINLSGEQSYIEKDEASFKSWYLEKIAGHDKTIPKIEYLKHHGNKFGEFIDGEQHSYNGYDIAYILVKYCIRHISDFPQILRDGQQISALEVHVLDDALNYYNELFQVKSIKDSFYNVETPSELMDYMDKNITYGWLDKENNRHVGTLEGFRENYRISSLEEIVSSRLGTCIEQAKLIKSFFDRIGIENKLFCRRKFETKKELESEIKMHCFVLFFYNGKWYHFEHSNAGGRGIHEYDSIESALIGENIGRDASDTRVLTEIPDIPTGLNFLQFNQYVNSFEPISISPYEKKL